MERVRESSTKERPEAPARRAGVSANDIVYYIAAQQYVRPTYRHLYCAIRVTQKNVPNSAILAREEGPLYGKTGGL